LEDLPPDLDLRSSAAAASGAAGVVGADACAAAAESMEESASEARRSLAPPSSRSLATAGRCTQRLAPSALLAFLHTPSIALLALRHSLAAADSCNELEAFDCWKNESSTALLEEEEDCGGDGDEEEERGKPVLKGKRSRHCRAVVAAVGWAGLRRGCAFWFDLCAARETGRRGGSRVICGGGSGRRRRGF